MNPEETRLDIQRTLGRLESQVSTLTDEVRRSNDLHDVFKSDIVNRVVMLERWRVYLTAFSAGATAIIGALGALVLRLLP